MPREELTSAFGLSYTAQNLSFIIGPAMVGPADVRSGVPYARRARLMRGDFSLGTPIPTIAPWFTDKKYAPTAGEAGCW